MTAPALPATARAAALVVLYGLLAAAEGWLVRSGTILPIALFAPGAALIGLYATAPRHRPAVALGLGIAATLAVFVNGLGLSLALLTGAVTVVQAAAGQWLLSRAVGDRLDLGAARDAGWLAAAALATAVAGGTVSALLVRLLLADAAAVLPPTASGANPSPLGQELSWWVLPQAIGTVLWAPLVLALAGIRGEPAAHPRERWPIFALNLVVMLLVVSTSTHDLIVLVTPTMVLIAIRLGVRDTVLGVLLFTVLLALATARGLGPIPLVEPRAGMQQLFAQMMVIAGFSALLPVAATIAQRRRLEERLAHNQEFTDQILQSVREIVFRTDRAGRWTFLNPAWEALTGYSVAESLGWPTDRLLLEDDRKVSGEPYRQLVAGEIAELTIFQRFRRRDGEVRDIEVSVRRMVDEHGAFAGTAGSIRDISQRRRQLDALERSERRFRALSDQAPVGILRLDPQGRIGYANPCAGAIFGYSPAELVGRFWTDLAPPETGALREAMRERVATPGTVVEQEIRIHRRGGSERWVHFAATGEFDGDGTFLGSLSAISDVSERHAAKEALAEAERRLRELTDNVNDMVIRIGLDGATRYVTPSIRRLLGFDPGPFVADPTLAEFHPDDLPRVRAAMHRLAHGEVDEITLSYRQRHADGHLLWLEANCRLLRDAAGNPAEIVAAVRDIDARMRLEADLIEARRRAEAAVEAKSRFLANLSHEIRTPMNGVIGLTDLLLDRPLDEETRHHVRLIAESGTTMMALLNDILDFSKVDSGGMLFADEPIELRPCLEGALAMIAAGAERRGIALSLTLDPALPAAIRGDHMRIRQILANLLGNALKFTEAGAIALEAAADGERLRIAIRDTGIGISPANMTRVFEEFAQERPETSARFGGTGLGLPIARRLAEAMGGDLSLESEPGVGTLATVVLPLVAADVPVSAAEALVRSEASGEPIRVLVAEDNRTNQIILGAMLSRLGHRFDMVDDGAAVLGAVERAGAEGDPYRLVLMDLMMPGLDGEAATRELRRRGYPPETLPILAVTAHAFEDDVAACLAAGFQGHLAKPIRLDPLAAAMAPYVEERVG